MNEILVLRTDKVVWASNKSVIEGFAKIYKSWESSECIVTEFVLNRENKKRTYKEIVQKSWNTSTVIHIVVIDTQIPFSDIAAWGCLTNPQRTVFHLHLFSDIVVRTNSFFKLLNGLTDWHVNVFVASNAVAGFIKEIYSDLSVHIVPFPIQDHFFETPLLEPQGITSWAYVGRLDVNKGTDLLLEFWDKHFSSDAQLFLAGEHTATMEWSLYSMSEWDGRNNQLLNSLRQLPFRYQVNHFTDPKALARFMVQMDFCISFSQFMLEEFGLAVIEAAACGNQLVLSRWGGHKDFISAPYAYFFDQKPSKDVFQLKRLRLDEKQEQRNWAKEKFSYDAVSITLRKVFFRTSFSPAKKYSEYVDIRSVWLKHMQT